jgi:hypothetical protein
MSRHPNPRNLRHSNLRALESSFGSEGDILSTSIDVCFTLKADREREENEMAESKDWKSWMPEPKGWKNWLPEEKGWKMSQKNSPNQGVVKRDWVATGRIDFATRLNGDFTDANQPSEFKLLVEERRIVESIAGNENLEIQWRLATLNEAKAVVTQFHKYLSENSLIKTVAETIGPFPGAATNGEQRQITLERTSNSRSEED